MGIRRETGVIVPHGNTRLSAGDTLRLVGTPEALEEARPCLTRE